MEEENKIRDTKKYGRVLVLWWARREKRASVQARWYRRGARETDNILELVTLKERGKGTCQPAKKAQERERERA